MNKLVRGVHYFHDHIYAERRDAYRRLADGQNPHTLFITCSDSRLDPESLTQSGPGDIFVLRNAGNLIPPYGAGHGGEAATLEYAVAGLGVRNIVVCGHSGCGAMRALLKPHSLDDLPVTGDWLKYAESTRHVVRTKYDGLLDFEERWMATVEENVLSQLDHVRTHPTVAAGLASGKLRLYGWVFDLEDGRVRNYDASAGQYLPLPPMTAKGEGQEPPAAYGQRFVPNAAANVRAAATNGRNNGGRSDRSKQAT